MKKMHTVKKANETLLDLSDTDRKTPHSIENFDKFPCVPFWSKRFARGVLSFFRHESAFDRLTIKPRPSPCPSRFSAFHRQNAEWPGDEAVMRPSLGNELGKVFPNAVGSSTVEGLRTSASWWRHPAFLSNMTNLFAGSLSEYSSALATGSDWLK